MIFRRCDTTKELHTLILEHDPFQRLNNKWPLRNNGSPFPLWLILKTGEQYPQ